MKKRTPKDKKYNILIVDDEEENLFLLEDLLSKEYEVFVALNGKAALNILKHQKIDVIIADQRMPKMTGIELLQESRSLYPDAIRILLTAYTDTQILVDAINVGHVYQFIQKPWDIEDIHLIIRRGLELYELKRKQTELIKMLKQRAEELERTNRELEEAKKIIAHQSKLATIGTFANEIIHEINNQLAIINILAEVAQQKYSIDTEFISEYIQPILEAVNNLNTMVTEIRDLARGKKLSLHLTECNLSLLIQEIVTFCRLHPDFKEHKIVTQVSPSITCFIDKRKIRQVIINLLKNASYVTTKGEEIKIFGTLEKEDVIIKVIDRGKGIPKEELNRIWEPFYSTKGDRGMGLGLNISRRIIEEHKGTISCKSKVGHGTTFIIKLPQNPFKSI
jgi:signal transduction histidine kinase